MGATIIVTIVACASLFALGSFVQGQGTHDAVKVKDVNPIQQTANMNDHPTIDFGVTDSPDMICGPLIEQMTKISRATENGRAQRAELARELRRLPCATRDKGIEIAFGKHQLTPWEAVTSLGAPGPGWPTDFLQTQSKKAPDQNVRYEALVSAGYGKPAAL